MIYCFDLDGVIADTTTIKVDAGIPVKDYSFSLPVDEVIAKVNSLYDDGHTIKIFTARGTVTGIDWRVVTESQLRRWGVKYHELIFGKPYADVYIDDKAINVKDWLNGHNA